MHAHARRATLITTFSLLLGAAAAHARQSVTPGELVVEPPTLISLGFEWHIDGDANRNAAVAVAYRQSGKSAWHNSLPLLRVQNEHTFYANTRITDGFTGKAPDLGAPLPPALQPALGE